MGPTKSWWWFASFFIAGMSTFERLTSLFVHCSMTVHLLIKGKVQGVFYRASAKDVAEQLQLTGWVRNTEEGEVEAVVSGDEDRIKEFIEWCKKGPRKAEVAKVIVTEKEEEPFESFRIAR